MVCMGNICRSPTAEAVFRHHAKQAALPVHIDSAGTISHHVGHKPDPRSVAAGKKRGYDFSQISARKVIADDFYVFDLILAMDQANYDDLLNLCPEPQLAKKVFLMLEFSKQGDHSEVPDPYYGGNRGFELVLDLIEDAAMGLINHIHQNR